MILVLSLSIFQNFLMSVGESEDLIFNPYSLAIPKIRSIKFVEQMFRDRNYRNSRLLFDQPNNMWQLFSETADGEKVVAIFADCKVFGDAMEIEEFHPSGLTQETTREKCKINPNQNAGMDFVKHIIKFAILHQLKLVILITDFMTSHALKHIYTVKDIKFSHFTYEDTGIECMHSHIMQPLKFQALDKKARAEYIKRHPLYATELPRYSIDDTLVKYYGMQLHDIVDIEDNDRQSGLVKEYGYIVEDL